MKVIGITGGVGSGKSELLRYISDHYNCRVIRSDEVSHELMAPGGAVYRPLVAMLEAAGESNEPAGSEEKAPAPVRTNSDAEAGTGTDSMDRRSASSSSGPAARMEKVSALLHPDGTIDHAEMARRIFGDKDLLTQVNALIHPAVRNYIEETIREERQSGKRDYLFIEAALLIEEGYGAIVDEMWYIYCRPEVRRQRLRSSRGYTDAKTDSIMRSQLSEEEFRRHADVVIDNSTTLDAAYRQIDTHLTKKMQ